MAGMKPTLVSRVLSFINANPELFKPAPARLPPELRPPWLLEAQGNLISGVKSCTESGQMDDAFSYLNSCLYLRTSTSIRGMSKLISFLRESFPVQVWTLRLLLLIKKKGCSFSRSLRVVLEHIRLLYEGAYKAIHKEETGPLPRLRDVLVDKRGAYLFLATETQLTSDIIQWIDLLYFLVSVLLKGPTETTIPMWEQLCTSMRKDLANERAFGPYLVCLNEIEVEGLGLPQEEQVTLLSAITTVEHFSCFNRLFVQQAMFEDAQFRLALLEKLHRLGLNKKLKDVIDLFHSERMDEFIEFFSEKLLSDNPEVFHVALTYYYEDLRQGNYKLREYDSRNLPHLLKVVEDPTLYKAHFELLKQLALFAVQKPSALEGFVDQFVISLPFGPLPAKNIVELMIMLITSRKSEPLYEVLELYISGLIDQMRTGTVQVLVVEHLVSSAIRCMPKLQSLVARKQGELSIWLKSIKKTQINVETKRRVREMKSFTENSFITHFTEEGRELEEVVEKCIRMLTDKDFDEQFSDELFADHPIDTFKLTPEGVQNLSLLKEHLICNLARTGLSNLKAIIDRNDQDRIDMYLSYFQGFKRSVAVNNLLHGDPPFYVCQFIVGHLRRLFLLTLDKGSKSDFCFEQCDTIAVHLELGSVKPLAEHQKTRVEALLTSKLVVEALTEANLSVNTLSKWVDKILFAPLVHLHGITLFGGTILINESYTGEQDFDQCGFILTLFHETAHLLRRVQNDVYDDRALTPVLDKNKGYDQYPHGMPGFKPPDAQSYRSEENHGEGGHQLEVSLFGMSVSQLNSVQISFLIDLQNWNLDKEDFNEQLTERASIPSSKIYEYGRTVEIYSFPRDNHSNW